MRIDATLLIVLILATWVCAPGAATRQGVCLPYEPKTVDLFGKLAIVQEYGPPNYGENPESDLKVNIAILRLSKAVDVCADSTSELNRDAFAVRVIQVIFGDTVTGRRFVDREVVVTGTLSEGITGHHFTNVLLTVSAIRLAQAGRK